MKRFLICAGFLLFSVLLTAQQDFKNEIIKILKSSELVIAGSTNVNKFNCEFDINKISGERTVQISEKDNTLYFKDFELHLEIDAFDCGNKRMNSDFQDLLVSEEFPEIVIFLNNAELISEEYAKAMISLEIAGHKRHYELPVHLDKNRFQGTLKINITDFQLEPPKKALGLIEVDEMIEVQFNLVVKN
ncbi:YceI family protein [Christiangramia forsetii]|uniref:Secreted protein n=2 Tax=Christiangramia forsetii TaxID=411153 RepID=A0M1A4_CHRFK|nr:YceI family protein [Christiangramia forsetii]GGG43002.1 hypothetical protein GCM10011532_28650 [Christiangramia forsetii]CAL66399.1 secreted protein [Christiangramia forsetii KT0803]